MKFDLWILLALELLLLLPANQGVIRKQWQEQSRVLRKHGPLYESVKLLIEAHSLAAAQQWNVTRENIIQHEYLVQGVLDRMQLYQQQVNARLDLILNSHNQYSPEFRNCYKKYERDVARFNRELFNKYSNCTKILDKALEHFELEILEEVSFMSGASKQIEALVKSCNVLLLKQQSINQAGTLLCVVGGIGGINQRMAVASGLIVDIMLELAEEELEMGSCRDYTDLITQFDEIYEKIQTCENKL